MNAEKFRTRKDGFDVPDLRARFAFASTSSIGFDLAMGRFHNTIIGGMQVHHPCVGHIKARVFIQLPKQYCEATILVAICQAAFRELYIPEDETYELFYSDMKDALLIDQPVNRDGITDRI